MIKSHPKYQERKHFCMIGNFRHLPNADAVQWMHGALWPFIRAALPQVELHVYGAYPPREMMSLSCAEQGFIVKGPIQDHLKMLRSHRVNLAALRVGAGIKGKVTDGWFSGTPCVATPIAAEGMAENHKWGGLIASSAKEIAESAIHLYSNESLWDACRVRGYNIMHSLYDEQKNTTELINSILDAINNCSEIRRTNTVGRMLLSEKVRGTKYFSLWIEEKQKRRNSEASPSHIASGETT